MQSRLSVGASAPSMARNHVAVRISVDTPYACIGCVVYGRVKTNMNSARGWRTVPTATCMRMAFGLRLSTYIYIYISMLPLACVRKQLYQQHTVVWYYVCKNIQVNSTLCMSVQQECAII